MIVMKLEKKYWNVRCQAAEVETWGNANNRILKGRLRCGTLACSTTLVVLLLLLQVVFVTGCGGTKPQAQNRDYFTSGSKEADQRASQRMAKDEQLTGSGEGAGEKGVKKTSAAKEGGGGSTNQMVVAQGKEALYNRLGSEVGISNIVSDFLQRVLQDPRVNWARVGVKRGAFRGDVTPWKATPQNVAVLQKHMVEFLALATGGPAHYEGKEMKPTHAGMNISNPEFDAAVGDLKASLDRLQIANKEQKELLSIIESTRPEIVEER